jgi:hypothetical protein
VYLWFFGREILDVLGRRGGPVALAEFVRNSRALRFVDEAVACSGNSHATSCGVRGFWLVLGS